MFWAQSQQMLKKNILTGDSIYGIISYGSVKYEVIPTIFQNNCTNQCLGRCISRWLQSGKACHQRDFDNIWQCGLYLHFPHLKRFLLKFWWEGGITTVANVAHFPLKDTYFPLAFNKSYKLNYLALIVNSPVDHYNENQKSCDLGHFCAQLRCQSVRLLHQSQYFPEIRLSNGAKHVICLSYPFKQEYIIETLLWNQAHRAFKEINFHVN